MNDSNFRLSRRDLLALTAATLGAGQAAAQPAIEIPTTSSELWRWLRLQPVLDLRRAYFDVAAGGPTLRAAMNTEYRARDAQSFALSMQSDDHWSVESTRLAAAYAEFIGCDGDELLFTRGAGEALAQVAGGLDLVSGDEVLTTNREHPAAVLPWHTLARRRGVVIRQVELPAPLTGPQQVLDAFQAAISDRTRVIAFSHVQYSDGAVLPVRELCQLARLRNAISVVDGAQALGMLDFSLRDLDCDFYAASFHKWLCGSHGSGALYIRRDMLSRIWPSQPRAMDSVPPIDVPTREPGQHGVSFTLHKMGNVIATLWPALRGSETAMQLHRRILRSRIEARIRELSLYARMRLQTTPGVRVLTTNHPGMWGGILTFTTAGRPAASVVDNLEKGNQVRARALHWPGLEEGAVRISLHAFNTHEELERLLQGLQRILR